jgi:hypothetical protein
MLTEVTPIDGLETYLNHYDKVDSEVVDYGIVMLTDEGVWS